jgi:hypothetical protein
MTVSSPREGTRRVAWTRGLTRLYLLFGVGPWLFYWFVVVPLQIAGRLHDSADALLYLGDAGAAEMMRADANYPAQAIRLLRELSDPLSAIVLILPPLLGYVILRLIIGAVRWIRSGFSPASQ